MNIFVPLLIGAVDMAKKQQDKIALSCPLVPERNSVSAVTGALIKIHTF